MKTTRNLKSYILGIIATIFLSTTIIAQVGINTTTPASGSMLDITSIDKGVLIPRVDIANLSTIAPITGGSTESLLVYNTNATTGRGFHYWSGIVWIPLLSDDWKATGNVGTVQGTNFVGTIDNVSLSFRTNNTERLRISQNGYLRSFTDGSLTNPIFSWDLDRDTGFFRSADDRFNLSAGGVEFIELTEGADDELTINDDGTDINTRIETNNEANALFVDGGNDNIGLGTNSPDTSSQLDMNDSDRGLLINRVTLSATNVAAPVTTPATGLLVYNTATSGSGNTAVSPGFYYWDGTRWVALDGTNGNDWSIDGNNGTNSTNNFLGTIDNVNLILRTNNTERMRLLNDGRVTVNNNNPFVGDRFTVTGASGEYAINAYATSGYGMYTQNAGAGFGLWADVNNAGAVGVVAANANSSGVGLSAAGAGSTPSILPTSGATFTGVIAGAGYSTTPTGTGLAGAGNGATTVYTLASGSGTAGSGNTTGIYGVAINTSGARQGGYFTMNKSGIVNETPPATDDPIALLAGYNGTDYYGGYFDGNQDNNSGGGGGNAGEDYAYVGIRSGGTTYKILGTGSNSTMVNDNEGNKRVLFSPEAPEILFEDYGTGNLVNGIATITLDPLLRSIIHVSNDHPMKVFIQLEGDCNGVFVTDKSNVGFTVKELNQGRSNVPFSWHIVANRADTVRNGEVVSRHVNVRFPIGPGKITPSQIVDNKAIKAKIDANKTNK